MPIYEYHCEECGSEFEKLMSYSDPKVDSPPCPKCNSENTRKRLSTIAAYGGRSSGASGSSSCGPSGGFR